MSEPRNPVHERHTQGQRLGEALVKSNPHQEGAWLGAKDADPALVGYTETLKASDDSDVRFENSVCMMRYDLNKTGIISRRQQSLFNL